MTHYFIYYLKDCSLCVHGPQRGIIVIFDMKNYRLTHVPKFTLKLVKIFMKYVQKALPAKLKVIHIFNISIIFKLLLALMKPFMESHIYEMVIQSNN